ncbi:MAG: lysylphosphatidylglycerol synthase transmembrane domain-containing protein, partial [Gallionella sp.]|nr:lysylphosphatidylglycerol synthase transmembrane domain-containing protein [Gallionella sp.]
RWLPGALISIALIAAILYFVDFGTMLDSIRAADYRLLAIAVVLSFIWLIVRAKVWQTLLRDKPPYKDVLFATGEGYLLNNFLPFRLGELGRAFLLSRKSGMPFGEILPTIFIERTVDLAFSAAIFLAALPFVVGTQSSERIGIIVGVIVIIGLVMMYILARNNQWALDLFHKLSARWPALQKTGGSFLESFFTGLGVLTDGWLFVRFLFWMTLDWAIALLAYYLMILAYFPQAQWTWGLFILGAAAFGGAVPSLPGAVGTFEGAVAGALTLLTNDQSTALAVALTARFYNYLNSGVIGGIGLLREGQTLSGIYQELMAFRKNEE